MTSEITERTKVLVVAEVHRVDPPWARVLLHPFSSVSTPVSQSSLVSLDVLWWIDDWSLGAYGYRDALDALPPHILARLNDPSGGEG